MILLSLAIFNKILKLKFFRLVYAYYTFNYDINNERINLIGKLNFLKLNCNF